MSDNYMSPQTAQQITATRQSGGSPLANQPIYNNQGQIVGYYDQNGTPRQGATSAQQANQMAGAAPAGTGGYTPGEGGMAATQATAASGVAPAGGAGNPGATPAANGTAAMTGYAGDYFAPLQLGETIYDNPAALFNHLLNTPQWQQILGPSNSSNPLNQALGDLPYDPLSLWAASTGATQQGLAGGDVGSYANFLADMAKNQITPGGQAWDFNELMGNLFSAGEGTVLNSLLTSGSGPQQVSNFYNMTRDVARSSLNPLAAQAALSQAKNAGNDYLTNYITGTGGQGANQTFSDWVATQRPNVAAAFTQR